MKSNDLWLVTFFKGIAIMMVILVHAAQKFSLPLWSILVPGFSQMGCQIFIVLSAFTICMSLERNNDSFFYYIKKRLKRIVPGFWGMILVYLLLAALSYCIVHENIFETDTTVEGVLFNIFLLHGFVPTTANNSVVRGGWFVGTIVILYVLTPMLFKWYKKMNAKTRWFCFPVLVFGLSFFVVQVLEEISIIFECKNNSFMYFSFINQIGCYTLGFSLWDLYSNNQMKKCRCPLVVSIIFAIASVCIFYSGGWEYAFVLEPMIFGIAFFNFFIWAQTQFGESKLQDFRVCKAIMFYGKYSYTIYLTHMLFAWEGALLLKAGVKTLGVEVSDLLLFVVWLPFMYIIALLIGVGYSKIIDKVTFLKGDRR